jgi:hypothetical protein
MLTTSPELVFHSAGVKKLIGGRTRGFGIGLGRGVCTASPVEQLSYFLPAQ